MASLQQFLMAHRADIEPVIYGQGNKDGVFEKIVAEVVAVAETERGRGITGCDPRSIIEAVRLAATWPLKIGTYDGAALVVTDEIVRGKHRLIAMQTAKAKLHILSQPRYGQVIHWHNAQAVYTGEIEAGYLCEQGGNPRIVCHPSLTMQPQKRGQLAGAYCWVQTKRYGTPDVLEEMNSIEIDEIRKTWSRELKDGELSDVENLEQYAVAKVTHRLCARLSMPDATRALLDDRLGGLPLPRRERGTITSPVHDPKSIVDAKPQAPVFDPFPRHRHAPRAMSCL